MEIERPILKICQLFVGLVFATLTGCGVMVDVDQVELQLTPATLAWIRPGVTTMRQMLGCLGPPLAIVRNDATPLRLPLPGAGQKQAQAATADQYFLPFAQRRAIEPDDTIYYYRGTFYRNFTPFIFDKGFELDYGVHEKRLWVLCNERNGRVKDLLEEQVTVGYVPHFLVNLDLNDEQVIDQKKESP